MFKEFKDFAMKGNVLDMAVGIIMGAAFGPIIGKLVDGILMPPLGLLLGNVDFTNIFLVLKDGASPGPYASLAAAKGAGAVVMAWGEWFNTIITFLITAFAVFMLVKGANSARRKQEAAPAAPPAPPKSEVLLEEIRDLLKKK
ncbi:large-conductance mechanosensitive channel protein MscL [bacterium]|jgi:large conductance mechanosensitive channel|nr:large-conductance mechanosensitive channel protein MscL [bacterium]